MSSPIRKGEPYSPERTTEIIDELNREGFAHLGPTLKPDEVEALRDAMQRKWADPAMHDEAGGQIKGISMMRMFEYSTAFRDLIVREPFASLAEAVLGEDCHMLAQNALRTEPVEPVEPGKSGGWHLDDLVHFPLNDEFERHDPRMTMPCMVLQVFTLLTDVDEVKYGPTEVATMPGGGPTTLITQTLPSESRCRFWRRRVTRMYLITMFGIGARRMFPIGYAIWVG